MMSASLVKYAYKHATQEGSPLLDLLTDPASVTLLENPPAILADFPIGRDPFGKVWYKGWIFEGTNDTLPLREVEDTSLAAVVFSSFNTWSPQSRFHRSKFPRLVVSIYADVTRNRQTQAPIKKDAEYKVENIYKAIDQLFHDPGNRIHRFGPDEDYIDVISTVEGEGLTIMETPKGDGSVRGTVTYDVTLL